MQVIKNELDYADFDMVLADDLCDKDGNFYDLTFIQALNEQLRYEPLQWCKYVIDIDQEYGKKLVEFLGYTDNRVIFHITGIGVMDILLDSLPRNPPRIDRFTI